MVLIAFCTLRLSELCMQVSDTLLQAESFSVLFFVLFYSVEDKQRVSTLTHIPMFLPEICIGAHDYDEKYYAYRSVRRDKTFILIVPGAYCWTLLLAT